MNESPKLSEKDFISVPCALCGREDAREYLRCADTKGVVPGRFRLVRCRCGLVYMNPRPAIELLAELYAGARFDYFHGGTAGLAHSRAELVKRFSLGGNRLLEVGTGDGSFLSCMKKQGWETVGIEIEEQAARRQREELGLDVRAGTLASAELPEGAFDAITYWDVFEHIPDPDAELARVRSLLSPGGAVIFSLPNIGSLEAKVFGARWFRLDMPRHLYHYTPDTLGRMLGRAGLKLKEARFATTATGVLNSLRPSRGMAASGAGGAARAGASRASAKKIVFDFGLAPMLKALDALGLGGHFVAAAVKSDRENSI